MGPRIVSYLKKQSSYVKELMKQPGGFDIVSAGEFIMSMRKLGYRTTFNALAELIDNAIEALSKKITILVKTVPKSGNYKTKHVGAFAVIDNGAGMEKDMIRAAMRWGGTHRYNERTGIGRFGIGLPGASGSLSMNYSVYSKLEDGDWWCVHMDLASLNKTSHKEGRATVPEAEKSKLPDWVVNYPGFDKSQSGTVVVINNPDLLTAGFVNTQSFVKNAQKHIAITYRNYLLDSQIEVAEYDSTATKKSAEYPKTKRTLPLDPLFLREECLYYDMDENPYLAEPQPELNIPVKHDNGEAIIKLRFAMFHPHFAEKKFGGKIDERFSVMKQNHCEIIICRNGRQMSLQKTTHYQTAKNNEVLQNNDRYWVMELDFPAVLDDAFNVSANKQSASPNDKIWALLERYGVPGIRKSMQDVLLQHKSALGDQSDENKEKESEFGVPTAKIMKEIDKFDSPTEIPQSIKDAIEDELEEIKKEKISSGKDEKEAEKDANFESIGLEYRFMFKDFGDIASFYKVKQEGRLIKVIFNTDHAFYKYLYSRTDDKVRKSLRLMVGVLAKSEIFAQDNKERSLWYKNERRVWSSRLQNALFIQEGMEPPEEQPEILENVEDVELVTE